MKNYTDWFFTEHLIPHFKIEESYLFPILGGDNDLVKKALAEHRRLKRLFTADNDILRNLNLIEEELELHIRFEERILLNEIQKCATQEDLENFNKNHRDEKFVENTADEFWI